MSDIKSLNFGLPKRKRFSIDGDESRVVELDTSDTGILARWNGVQEWLSNAANELEELSKAAPEDDVNAIEISKRFAEIDTGARQKINYLFDSDVCTPIAGNGALIRLVNGDPLFMLIVETLVPLYEADIKVEYEKSKKRIAKHTAKYTTK